MHPTTVFSTFHFFICLLASVCILINFIQHFYLPFLVIFPATSPIENFPHNPTSHHTHPTHPQLHLLGINPTHKQTPLTATPHKPQPNTTGTPNLNTNYRIPASGERHRFARSNRVNPTTDSNKHQHERAAAGKRRKIDVALRCSFALQRISQCQRAVE